MALYNYGSGGSSKTEKETKQRCTADNAYHGSFIDIWSKTFGHKYLTERKAVAKKSEQQWECSLTKCFTTEVQLSKQKRVKEWRKSSKGAILKSYLKMKKKLLYTKKRNKVWLSKRKD